MPPRQRLQLLNWAYLGYVPTLLERLKTMALDERWEFRNSAPDPAKPHPILYSYLCYTFDRLRSEKKVTQSTGDRLAAFNTGLVDHRYEPIYALFGPNQHAMVKWKLLDFCTPGEGREGQNLVRYFNPLPLRAHYFENPTDLYYDPRSGEPELNWEHVLITNIDRFPTDFIEDYGPKGFSFGDAGKMSPAERETYFSALGAAIKSQDRTYRLMMSRVKEALAITLKRIAWNFKTAIPQYYPRTMTLTLSWFSGKWSEATFG
jgi:hypothetical protein